MERQVILNADDFGLTRGVNAGIVRAYLAGGLTSASLMVNMPGFGDAVRLARALPGLGVGLHFNLTYGRPLSDPKKVPSLVTPDGAFLDGKIPRVRAAADVARELEAQWNRFAKTDLSPTHLDSHQLLHQTDPVIYKVMAEKACRENIPLRRSQVVHPLPDAPQPRMTDTILLDTYGDDEGLQRLRQHLRSLPEGIAEIVCHPGCVDEALREISAWTDIRERELKVFASREVSQALRELGIVPVNYRMVRDRPAPADIPLPVRPAAKAQPVHRRRSAKRRSADGPGGKLPPQKRSRLSRRHGAQNRRWNS